MARQIAIAGVLASLGATSAIAGPFDGLYIPRGQAGDYWNCVYNGQEAGAIWIEDNWYHPIEDPLCRLSNPVEVRDMPAVLYDLVCDEGNQNANERVMFVRQADGLFEIRSNWMVDWEKCAEE